MSKVREGAFDVVFVLVPFGERVETIEAILLSSELILGILASLQLRWPRGLIPKIEL